MALACLVLRAPQCHFPCGKPQRFYGASRARDETQEGAAPAYAKAAPAYENGNTDYRTERKFSFEFVVHHVFREAVVRECVS